MENYRPIGTPIDANFKMDMIISMMYPTIDFRPDLTASVYYLSTFQANPCIELCLALNI